MSKMWCFLFLWRVLYSSGVRSDGSDASDTSRSSTTSRDKFFHTASRQFWTVTSTTTVSDPCVYPRELKKCKKLSEQGQFGIVKVCDLDCGEGTTNQKVAVKEITPEGTEANERLKNEIFVSLMGSPFTPAVFGYNHNTESSSGRCTLLASEFAEGGDLSKWMKVQRKKDKTNWQMRLKFMVQVSRGLAFLHANSILHRDIKVENVLLAKCTSTNTQLCAKLADFGFACRVEGPSIATKVSLCQAELCGSPTHLAPEGWDRTWTQHADIWSLGVTMYEVFSSDGQVPFDPEVKNENIDKRVNDINNRLKKNGMDSKRIQLNQKNIRQRAFQDEMEFQFKKAVQKQVSYTHLQKGLEKFDNEGVKAQLLELIGQMLTVIASQRPSAQTVADKLVELMKIDSLSLPEQESPSQQCALSYQEPLKVFKYA